MVDYNKIIISGTLPGDEVFSINLAFWNPDPSVVIPQTFEDLRDWAEGVRSVTSSAAFPDLFQALSSGGAVTKVRAEYRDAGLLKAAGEANFFPVRPGTGAVNKPNQCSIVISLLSDQPGRSRRGRVYWPALNATMSDETGRFTAPVNGAVATDFSEYLSNMIAVSPVAGMLPVIYSPTLDIVTPVTQCSVGDVIDTQRRRRDSLAENRASWPVPTPI